MELHGKVAIVTGAKLEGGHVGIGGAVARLLARGGGRVALVNRTLASARALADELNAAHATAAGEPVAVALAADLRVDDDIAAAVARTIDAFGSVDVLVNNAAVTGDRSADQDVLSVESASWDAIYALNVRAPFLLIKAVLPAMLERGSGSIVNVSSTASLAGDVIRTAYGSSKAALNTLTQYVATQYGRLGIRCNAVVPGFTVTGNVQRNTPPETWRVMERQVLRPQPNDAVDLANVVTFLASDASAGINGEVIRVDGGFFSHSPYASDLRDLLSARNRS